MVNHLIQSDDAFMRMDKSRLWLMVAAFFAIAGLPVNSIAEDFPDPTRPPAIVSSPGSASPASDGELVLQSIYISSHKRSAIISGMPVELGQNVGDARLVKVSEGEVVLQSGSDKRTLKLFPDVEKRFKQLQPKSRLGKSPNKTR